MSKGRIFAIGGAVLAALAVGAGLTILILRPAAPAAASNASDQAQPAQYTPIFTSTVPATPSFDMKGALTLFVPRGSTPLKNGDACQGTGSYADAKISTPVQVFDASGKGIATGVLGQGVFVDNPLGTACKFEFTVSGVPDGLPNYGVEVGEHGVQTVNSSTAHSWVSFSETS